MGKGLLGLKDLELYAMDLLRYDVSNIGIFSKLYSTFSWFRQGVFVRPVFGKYLTYHSNIWNSILKHPYVYSDKVWTKSVTMSWRISKILVHLIWNDPTDDLNTWYHYWVIPYKMDQNSENLSTRSLRFLRALSGSTDGSFMGKFQILGWMSIIHFNSYLEYPHKISTCRCWQSLKKIWDDELTGPGRITHIGK